MCPSSGREDVDEDDYATSGAVVFPCGHMTCGDCAHQLAHTAAPEGPRCAVCGYPLRFACAPWSRYMSFKQSTWNPIVAKSQLTSLFQSVETVRRRRAPTAAAAAAALAARVKETQLAIQGFGGLTGQHWSSRLGCHTFVSRHAMVVHCLRA